MARLHHVRVPSADHLHAAAFLAMLFGTEASLPHRPDDHESVLIGSVRLMFCEAEPSGVHLAFHVTPREFDEIMARMRKNEVAYGDGPEEPINSRVRTDDRGYGYRAIWSLSPDATLLEFFCFDRLPEGFMDPSTVVGMR